MADDNTTTFTFRPLADKQSMVRAIVKGMDDVSLPILDIRATARGFKVIIGKEVTKEEQADVIVLIKQIERTEIQDKD